MNEQNLTLQKAFNKLNSLDDKYATFHKTIVHLHTPESYDYTLLSAWNSKYYESATDQEIYKIFLENTTLNKSNGFTFDKVEVDYLINGYKSIKEYLSFLVLAEQLIKESIELIVVTDHNTTNGIKKLKQALQIIYCNNNNFIFPQVLSGVEISAADKLHIIAIFDHSKTILIDRWLEDNLLNEKEGSFQHSLNIINDLNDLGILNYIAHFNTSNILKAKSNLSGGYKNNLFTDTNVKYIGVNNLNSIDGLKRELNLRFKISPNCILDNDSHDIDGIKENYIWIKGSKLNQELFFDAMQDYNLSIQLTEPVIDTPNFIKGIYIQKRDINRSFLIGPNCKIKLDSLSYSEKLDRVFDSLVIF